MPVIGDPPRGEMNEAMSHQSARDRRDAAEHQEHLSHLDPVLRGGAAHQEDEVASSQGHAPERGVIEGVDGPLPVPPADPDRSVAVLANVLQLLRTLDQRRASNSSDLKGE